MVSMWYAMREALALVAEEGLEPMWARHEAAHKQLWEGLGAMGLQPFVEDPADRLVTVNTVKVGGAASDVALFPSVGGGGRGAGRWPQGGKGRGRHGAACFCGGGGPRLVAANTVMVGPGESVLGVAV